MSPRLPIVWDAACLGNLPEDPGTSGYPANCGVLGGARILGQSPRKVASQSIGSLGDIYFADTGTIRAGTEPAVLRPEHGGLGQGQGSDA